MLLTSTALNSARARLEDALSDDAQQARLEYMELEQATWDFMAPRTACSVALSTAASGRNRYCDVLALDATRVKLGTARDGSDYINANLLSCDKGEDPPWSYIATQGPVRGTVADFWQMVHEQRSDTIIMLTRLKEGSSTKCDDYTGGFLGPDPSEGPATVGDVELSLQSLSTPFVGCELRQFLMHHTPSGARRIVRHFTLPRWADHGVPSSPAELLRLLRILRSEPPSGPPVVHCSAGIGRTGTLVAIDVAVKRLHTALQTGDDAVLSRAVALDELLLRLRRQRQGLVQTAEQYVFCYRALLAELRAATGGDQY